MANKGEGKIDGEVEFEGKKEEEGMVEREERGKEFPIISLCN